MKWPKSCSIVVVAAAETRAAVGVLGIFRALSLYGELRAGMS
jgi:hypothetical protein